MKRDKVERKTMFVKSDEGNLTVAWVETVTYGKPELITTKWMQKDPDGIIREHERTDLMNGYQTGDCPECHQMPCPHTAKLLGW